MYLGVRASKVKRSTAKVAMLKKGVDSYVPILSIHTAYHQVFDRIR